MKNIKSALISVFDKDNLEPIVKLLHANGVEIYSTGGTQSFIESFDIPVIAVEDLTSYPSIFGGRVKTDSLETQHSPTTCLPKFNPKTMNIYYWSRNMTLSGVFE